MAFTERYVTVTGAGAHDGTTEADAWTFAEMIAATPAAGVRVNMKAGTYSIGSTTVPAGSAVIAFVIRGYNATIGDLDALGRNADGTLNTTNMPDVTITALWVPGALSVLQNLDVTGALSGPLIGSTANDGFSVISCRVVNTQNNAAAIAVQGDDAVLLLNSDFDCTGAAHGNVVDMDDHGIVIGCRFHGTDTDGLLSINHGQVINTLFYGNAAGVGIQFNAHTAPIRVIGNTFYGLGTAVTLPNLVNTTQTIFVNNHVTDCGAWINSLYSATAAKCVVEAHNRTRDVTTLLAGIEALDLGAVASGTTGDASTDFVDAGAGNFRLVSGAPGKAAGLVAYMDIGAYQREEEGSGGAVYHGAMGGGCI